MSGNVGQFIGLDGTPLTSNSFFDIARRQPGEITMENRVGSKNALTASQQGVYTCRIPKQSGEMRYIIVGVYPSGFNSESLPKQTSGTPSWWYYLVLTLNMFLIPAKPSIVALTSQCSASSSTLTCTSTGSPATTVSWTRNGQPVTIDGNTYQLTQTVTDRAASTYENVLTINQPLASILGSTFTCTVTNIFGSVTSNSVQIRGTFIKMLIITVLSVHAY